MIGLSRPSLLMLTLMCAISAMRADEFYVSPRGSDANPGTFSRPFLTLTRARDAIRTLRKPGTGHTAPVTVHLRGGFYRLTEPLVLTPEDGGTAAAPVVYSAYRDERPVLSGGYRITGWKRGGPAGKRRWTATLPVAETGLPRSLWIDGHRRVNARYPDKGYLNIYGVPYAVTSSPWNEGQWGLQYAPGDLPARGSFEDGRAVVMSRWTEAHLPVVHRNDDSLLLRFGLKSVVKFELGDTYYLLNAKEGLDREGEWRVTPAGVLEYLPVGKEEAGRVAAVVPVLQRLLVIQGEPEKGRYVEHLTILGLTFSHTQWWFPDTLAASKEPVGGFGQAAVGVSAAIEAVGLRNSSLERCTVTQVGTYGLWLARGSSSNRIVRCTFSDLGAGGIKIGETTIAPSAGQKAAGNTVIDCSIHDGGKLFHSAVGIWIGQSPDNRIVHNRIYDLFYSGLSVGWTWGYGAADAGGNIVSMNHVHHVGRKTDGDGPVLADMGGIYTLGGQPGTLIRKNVFHDIVARTYGGWGIYYDEGSRWIVSEGNLVYRTSDEGFHQHYGKENLVRNNIFAFGKGHQVARSRSEPHTSFAFERNIVYWHEGPMFFYRTPGGKMVFDQNLYWRTDAVPLMADVRVISDWRQEGFDLKSEFRDPLFVAPEKGDFRLSLSSPAHGMGLDPVDVARTLDPAPLTAAEEREAIRTTPRRRLLFNSDGTNVYMACDSITPAKAYERVDALAGTGITTFLFCVNPGQNLAYPSRIAPMFHYEKPAESTATWHNWAQRMSNNLASLVRDSLDPVGLILERAKLRGMEGFLTCRMNELHDVDKPASPLLSPFWREHPEYRVGGYEGWGAYALNYAIPEVREYYFRILEELCARYPLDGLELDFMRFPYYFPYDEGRMAAYADTMTAFVQRVRRMTESRGSQRGRPILLAARIPSSLKGCAYVGLDPARWCGMGLVDFVTAAPFLSTEPEMPVGEFKKVCGAVPVYAALEYTMGSRMMVREETRAAAARHFAAGADGIYLFNYFIAWDEAIGISPDLGFLRELLSPDSLAGKDKLYTLCAAKYPVPNVSLTAPLPVRVKAGERAELVVQIVEPRRPRKAILRIESDAPLVPGDLNVVFNGTGLAGGRRPEHPQIFPRKIPHPLTPVDFAVEYVIDPGLLTSRNMISLTPRRDLRVDWIYLGIQGENRE